MKKKGEVNLFSFRGKVKGKNQERRGGVRDLPQKGGKRRRKICKKKGAYSTSRPSEKDTMVKEKKKWVQPNLVL